MNHANQAEIQQVLAGNSSVHFVRGDDLRNKPVCVMSGAFNPIHDGHREMATFGAAHLGRSVVFELSVANAEKPTLTLDETHQRIDQDFGTHSVALTSAPTFLEKATIFPGAVFLVGVDTVFRIGQPRFYGDDPSLRDMAISELAAFQCRFLVFGRQIEDRFVCLRDVPLPDSLLPICDEVSEREFRSELSSSHLRNNP